MHAVVSSGTTELEVKLNEALQRRQNPQHSSHRIHEWARAIACFVPACLLELFSKGTTSPGALLSAPGFIT